MMALGLADRICMSCNVSRIQIRSATSLANDLGEEATRVADGALLRLVVEGDQTEPGHLTLVPLPVVDEAPVVVAVNRNSSGPNRAQHLEVLPEVARPERVDRVARAVLGDPDGQAVGLPRPPCHLTEPGGIHLPAEVVDGHARGRAVVEARHGRAGVVVEAEE